MGELIAVDSITVSPISDIHCVLKFYLYTDDEISYGSSIFNGTVNNSIETNKWRLTTSDNTEYNLYYYETDTTSPQQWTETQSDDDIDFSNSDNLKQFLYEVTVTVYSDLAFSVTKVSKSVNYATTASFSSKITKLENNSLSNVIDDSDSEIGLRIMAKEKDDDGNEKIISEIILGDGEINIGTYGEETYSTFSSNYVQFGHYRLEADPSFETNDIGESAAGLIFKFYG